MQHKANLSGVLFAMVLFFGTLPHITADMYVPSFPALAEAFQSDEAAIQLTLAVYMFAFSVSHLFYGPISDRIGRRKPMLFGIGLSVLGSSVCLFAPTISFLIVGRFIQGVGVAACNSIGRSFMRDLVSGHDLARITSQMSMMMTLATALSPTVGGYIQHYFGWRGNFLVLFMYTSVVLFLVYRFLPETNQQLNPDAVKIKVILRNYFSLLSDKTFLGYTLCSSMAYASVIAYITSAPFLLQTVVGLTPIQYGWLAFLVAAAVFVSAFINSKLVLNKGIERMTLVGVLLMLSSSIIMLCFGLLGIITLLVIIVPFTFFIMGIGFTFTNAFAGASRHFAHIAGSAGALFGCLQIFGGSLASTLMATLHSNNQIPLATVLIILSVASLLSWRFLAKERVS